MNNSFFINDVYVARCISIKKTNFYIATYLNLLLFVSLLVLPLQIPLLFLVAGFILTNMVCYVRFIFHRKWYREYIVSSNQIKVGELKSFQKQQSIRSVIFFTLCLIGLNILLNLLNDSKTVEALIEVFYLSLIASSVFLATHKCYEPKRFF